MAPTDGVSNREQAQRLFLEDGDGEKYEVDASALGDGKRLHPPQVKPNAIHVTLASRGQLSLSPRKHHTRRFDVLCHVRFVSIESI